MNVWPSQDYLRMSLKWTEEDGKEEFAVYIINQQFDSQRLELHQANQGTHHAHRDNIKLFELNTKNGIYQENNAKD